MSALLLVLVFATALMSGVFGMAGGLVLMGAFTALMPVSAAMVTHGLVQLIANGWRAVLHRAHIRWPIIGFYGVGAGIVAAVLSLVSYAPSKAWVYLLLGLTPLAVWLPAKRLALDAGRPAHALASGALVTGMNVLAGVAGPLLDIFFVRTALDRHAIVATKAATQTLAHLAKIAFYGLPLLTLGAARLPDAWFFVIMVPVSMAGTWAGGLILKRFSDEGFKRATRWLVSAIGLLYIATAARLFMDSG